MFRQVSAGSACFLLFDPAAGRGKYTSGKNKTQHRVIGCVGSTRLYKHAVVILFKSRV